MDSGKTYSKSPLLSTCFLFLFFFLQLLAKFTKFAQESSVSRGGGGVHRKLSDNRNIVLNFTEKLSIIFATSIWLLNFVTFCRHDHVLSCINGWLAGWQAGRLAG